MAECETRGCRQTADHTVTFENPEEQVGYCEACAVGQYIRTREAVKVERGYDGD